MCDKNCQVEFESVDIVYKPVKCLHEIIECYFTNEINQAFIAYYQCSKNGKLNSTTGFARHLTYCMSKNIFEKHLRVCAKKPGVVYSFNNRHLTTFEDNFKLMGDQPFSAYFDLETTCGKGRFV